MPMRPVFAALALLALLEPIECAARTELAVGIVNKIEDEASVGTASIAWVTDAKHPYEFTLGQIRPREDDIAPAETYIAASKRLTWRRWYTSSGIALADTPKDNRTLSGPLQFLTTIGWSAESWSISLRHLSNAGIEGRNHGETYLMVALHY
ncbi:MAG TPA: acyloxyacyl hydrolase [Candidatus Saccharimonadia bacterium]|nr:acyloxyacyl hydrolase [Candidatus Saccharimonadia bacterium]